MLDEGENGIPVLTAKKRKHREANVFFVNIAGQIHEILKITACALHSVEWKHLHCTTVLLKVY